MLLLTFKAAESLYAVDVVRVVEVVPRVHLRRLPHAPDFLAGLFDYRGRVVPVADLGALLGSEPCRDRLGTRIILTDVRPGDHDPAGSLDPAAAETRAAKSKPIDRRKPGRQSKARRWLFGLIAEQVTDMASIMPGQVISSPMRLPQAPYLGAIVEIDQKMVQLISVDKVIDGFLRESFFGTSSVEANGGVSEGEVEGRPG